MFKLVSKITHIELIALFITLGGLSNAVLANGIQDSLACIEQIKQEPKLALLKNKVALASPKGQTFSMLVDSTFPTEQERPLIQIWVDMKSSCASKVIDDASIEQSIRDAQQRMNDSFIEIAVDLYQGKLTFGDFAKKRVSIEKSFITESEANKQNLNASQNKIDSVGIKLSTDNCNSLKKQQSLICSTNPTFQPVSLFDEIKSAGNVGECTKLTNQINTSCK